MSRYGNNIRRIAQTEELDARIKQAESQIDLLEKGQIPGARATAYNNGIVEKGSPGVTTPSQNESPDNSSIYPNKDIINSGGIDDTETDGDALMKGDVPLERGDKVGAVELKDCESGEAIMVRFNTGANEGETVFKHPDVFNRDGTTTDPSYTEGLVWKIISGVTSIYANGFDGMIAAREALDSSTSYGIGPAPTNTIINTPAGFSNSRIAFSTAGQSVGASLSGGTIYTLAAYSAGITIGIGNFGQQDCGLEAGSNSACIAPAPPLYDTWQEYDPTYKHQLAFSVQNGGFISSAYDADIPLKFKNESDNLRGLNNLQLCTPDGNGVIVSALRDGTFAYLEDDGFGGPKEGGRIFHFDSTGKYLDDLREDEYRYLKVAGS